MRVSPREWLKVLKVIFLRIGEFTELFGLVLEAKNEQYYTWKWFDIQCGSAFKVFFYLFSKAQGFIGFFLS